MTKLARLVGLKNSIVVELLGDNMQRMFMARIPECRCENNKLLLGSSNAITHARFVYQQLIKRGYVVEVDDVLGVVKLIRSVAANSWTPDHIRKLAYCLGCRWVGLDIKLEIGRLFAQLYNENERGGGLNGFRLVEISTYVDLLDSLKAKNRQICGLLQENDQLRAQIVQQRQLTANTVEDS